MSNNLEIIELKSHVYGINFPLLEKRNENLISFDETTTERKKRRMERSKSFETWARPCRNITDRDCRCNDKPVLFRENKKRGRSVNSAENIEYRHKLETCCNGGGLDGIISRSSRCCWRWWSLWWWWWWWLIPLRASGGEGDRWIESCNENSTSWSSFRHSHSPSTDTRKLHRYMVSWAPAMSSSSMTPPWCTPWSPAGLIFRPFWDSCRIEEIVTMDPFKPLRTRSTCARV